MAKQDHSFTFGYLRSLISLKKYKDYSFLAYMKNFDFKEKQFQISDAIESYFEWIATCDISDGRCISRCVEILKNNDS